MIKSWLTVFVASLVLVLGTIWEQIFIKNTFDDFKERVIEVYLKTQNEESTSSDIVNLQEFWYEKKKTLHIVIPHNEIKEIDLWLAESRILIESEKFDDALSKIDVVIELTEQIPKTFLIKTENIL